MGPLRAPRPLIARIRGFSLLAGRIVDSPPRFLHHPDSANLEVAVLSDVDALWDGGSALFESAGRSYSVALEGTESLERQTLEPVTWGGSPGYLVESADGAQYLLPLDDIGRVFAVAGGERIGLEQFVVAIPAVGMPQLFEPRDTDTPLVAVPSSKDFSFWLGVSTNSLSVEVSSSPDEELPTLEVRISSDDLGSVAFCMANAESNSLRDYSMAAPRPRILSADPVVTIGGERPDGRARVLWTHRRRLFPPRCLSRSVQRRRYRALHHRRVDGGSMMHERTPREESTLTTRQAMPRRTFLQRLLGGAAALVGFSGLGAIFAEEAEAATIHITENGSILCSSTTSCHFGSDPGLGCCSGSNHARDRWYVKINDSGSPQSCGGTYGGPCCGSPRQCTGPPAWWMSPWYTKTCCAVS